jgi:hypothetical protein
LIFFNSLYVIISVDEKHAIICDIKRVASDLGETPTYQQYIIERRGNFPERQVRKYFGGYTLLVQAAGLDPTKKPGAGRQKKFKFIPSKLQGFTVHEAVLEELFAKAGNPEVLKVFAEPDTHVDKHDERVVKASLELASDWQPHVWLNMGDFGDMGPISHWPQDDFEPRRLVPQMKKCREILQRIQDATPSCSTRIFIEGNHEDWLRQALVAKLPELFDGIEELGVDVSVRSLFGLDHFGYEFIPLNHFLKIGHAYFTHGLYTGANHPAKHLKLGKNIYYGHLHDDSSAVVATLEGPMEAKSLGTWARADAPFLKGKPNNWTHNLSLFEFLRDGTYTLYCPKLINGRLSYNGKIYDGNK